MSSLMFCRPGVVAGFASLYNLLESPLSWSGNGSMAHRALLEELEAYGVQLAEDTDVMRSLASFSIEELNGFLEDVGSDMRFTALDGAGFASHYERDIEWLEVGDPAFLERPGKSTLSGFQLNEGVSAFTTRVNEHPILVLKTKTPGVSLIASRWDDASMVDSPLSLHHHVKRLLLSLDGAKHYIQMESPPWGGNEEPMPIIGMRAPNIDLSAERDLSGDFAGFQVFSPAHSQPFTFVRQSCRFYWNREGAGASATTIGGNECASMGVVYDLDHPFVVAFVRDNKIEFSAYIDEEDFEQA